VGLTSLVGFVFVDLVSLVGFVGLASLVGFLFVSLASLVGLVDLKVISCNFHLKTLGSKPTAKYRLRWEPNWRLTVRHRLRRCRIEPGTAGQRSDTMSLHILRPIGSCRICRPGEPTLFCEPCNDCGFICIRPVRICLSVGPCRIMGAVGHLGLEGLHNGPCVLGEPFRPGGGLDSWTGR
jgi:hypothetical protein